MTFINKDNPGDIVDIALVHRLFEKQCETNSGNVAIEHGDNRITYSTLNSRAGELASVIQANFPDDPIIAVSCTRSAELVIAVLAILKAGKAYLPLDVTYPKERLQTIIADAGISACVSLRTEQSFFSNLGLTPVLVDLSHHQPFPLGSLPGPLAYTLYTSGSTGKPKGVCMGHLALVNLLNWQKNHSRAGLGTRTLQFAPLTFDVSFQEIFATLTTGGTLCMIDDDLRLDPSRLLRFIQQSSIHRLFLPFVALQQLAELAEATNVFPSSLQEIMTAGEQLKITPQVSRFFSRLNSCTLFNQYGPTEAHVVTSLELKGDPAAWPALPTIGTAIDNTSILILDDQLNLVAKEEAGELCITGICLAEGYLNNDDLTKEKFINWTHPTLGKLRIYRTGDLARYLPDGNIEFLGRRDDQVKIRGHRIELAEIEVALNNLKGIQQAVVIAREDVPGQKRLVAYLLGADQLNDTVSVRKSLQKVLPDYMMPSAFMWVEDFPKTSSGKVDKKSLPRPEMKRPELSSLYKAPRTETEKRVAKLWSQLLGITDIGSDDNFFELGGNSLLAVRTVIELKQQFNYELPVTKLYQHATIESIAGFLTQTRERLPEFTGRSKSNADIAVIGMAGRFPGADTIDELWNILKDGKETISFFSNEELHASIPAATKKDPAYVKARGIINHADCFDAAFFGLNPRVAALMDPQQRVFLELAYEVLEQTGHLPEKFQGSIGVFAGSGNNSYYVNNVLPNKELVDKVGAFQVMTVNEKDYIATRVAYQLNLKGPAVSVYSGCSTSLLAIAQAAESIRNGKCNVALAGGVSIHAPIKSGQYYEEGAMFSPDGHCRPFDQEAKGTVFSDGAGIVLLKSLDEAIRDNDTIFAVLKGIGYNNDGSNKASFTAPSAEGQAGAILQAMHDAGVKPSDISYVEAHGTATPLGDPIEIEGLSMAFGPDVPSQSCAIGSIKSNLGHLTAAAGVAGFIKTALALHHKQIPASLHYRKSNPNINFDTSPFFVNVSSRKWAYEGLRRAGVSSFGVGGTNVHVILEEFSNASHESSAEKEFKLFTWSAKTDTSREKYGEALQKYLHNNPQVKPADVAFTLQTTRPSFNYRGFLVAGASIDFSEGFAPSLTNSKKLEERVDAVAFIFPGQGSQYLNMGLDVYQREPVFREAVDQCAAILENFINADIRSVIFPRAYDSESNALNNTAYTQPGLFTIEYALSKLYLNWGIQPSALCGHSIGEYVAAHLSGILSLEDALKLVASRSSMMSKVLPGKMLSVQSTEADIRSIMPQELSIAAINTSRSCVVSGSAATVENFATTLKNRGIASRVLNTSHAFHSSMMDEIVEPFLRVVETVVLNKPQLPIVSTATGRWMRDEEATDPSYWANQLRATVRFADAMNTLHAEDKFILLEAGPGNVTATLARQELKTKLAAAIPGLSTDNKAQSEYYSLFQNLGGLWLNGIEPDWDAIYAGQRRKILRLPTYHFDRKYCWVEAPPEITSKVPASIEPGLPVNIQQEPLPQKTVMRKEQLVTEISELLEDASGIEIQGMSRDIHFMELGLDSLSLTQVSLSLKKRFNLPITFRQLIEDYSTISGLAEFIDSKLPQENIQSVAVSNASSQPPARLQQPAMQTLPAGQNETVLGLLSEQIQLLAKQVALLQNGGADSRTPMEMTTTTATPFLSPEEETEIKKPFGATARIQKQSVSINAIQQKFIENFIAHYTQKTPGSKAYTQKHRSTMADPRVVTGFHPLIKEMIYPIVVNRSSGSRLWDIDGNEYIDVLNGFGSNLLGYQNEWVKRAIQNQIDKGYVGSSRVDLQACKLEYSIVSPK